MMPKTLILRWLVGGLFACEFQIHAANITWSDPITVANPSDVCVCGLPERAYCLGGDRPIIVKGVDFLPLNAPNRNGDVRLPENISDGQTEIVVTGDGDGIFAQKGGLSDGLALAQDYKTLLASGISDDGSALALSLYGLMPGRTYVLQVWLNDAKSSSATEKLGDGGNLSPEIHFNANATPGSPGQYIIGVLVADDEQEVISINPDGRLPLLNAFQLRVIGDNAGLQVIKQPVATANYQGRTVRLSTLAAGNSLLTYQWQKMVKGRARDLYDNDETSGTTNNVLIIQNLGAGDAGSYHAIIHDGSSSIASALTEVSLLQTPDELINVDINNGPSPTYQGDGVLVENSGYDVWNGIDGRKGFDRVPLVNSGGAKTEVTLSLSKPREDGFTRDDIPNALLKDYSPASAQTVTLAGLPPDNYYNLVVYCLGRAPNEGGVLDGAIKGIVYGGYFESDLWCSRFILNTNYLQAPFAKSDAAGTLRFTITATSSLFQDGFFNGDFNGLQIERVKTNGLTPAFIQQPQPANVYRRQPVTLIAHAVAPPGGQVSYQWQKVNTNGVIDLADGVNLHGSTNEALIISNLTAALAGNYRLLAQDQFGFSTSAIVNVSALQSPHLINIDIKNSAELAPIYDGPGILRGVGSNIWNGIDGRRSFRDATLVDSDGDPTVVTLSLAKEQVDSYTNPRTANNLLKDYSVGHPQTITLKHLEPDRHYRLVAYSYGAMENEGGVYSGALTGVVTGWVGSPDSSAQTFIKGTNYIENDSALTDTNGTLTFTIQSTSTVNPKGFANSDFNGLQIMRVE